MLLIMRNKIRIASASVEYGRSESWGSMMARICILGVAGALRPERTGPGRGVHVIRLLSKRVAQVRLILKMNSTDILGNILELR
jgi:hypothetical protein